MKVWMYKGRVSSNLSRIRMQSVTSLLNPQDGRHIIDTRRTAAIPGTHQDDSFLSESQMLYAKVLALLYFLR